MNKRKYTKKNPRRSVRLAKKYKPTPPPLPELPYEVWLNIADFLPVLFLRDKFSQGKHLVFIAFRDSLLHRLNNVACFVNFERLCLHPHATNGTKASEIDYLKKHFPKSHVALFRMLCLKDQMTNLKRTVPPGPVRLTGVQTITRAFCGIWLQLILQQNTTSSFAFTTTLSGANVPQGHKNFWDDTYLFSFQISNLFLLYHYDFHLRASQPTPKKSIQLHCCFPGKWECVPSCEHRRWATWSLMELRGRLENLMKHGLAWLCEKHFERVGIYLCERYCPLQGQGLTYTHVYVGADCAFPPN